MVGVLDMTEANDPARVLQIVFDNLISHRRNLIDLLNKAIAKQAKLALAIEQAANDADLKRHPFKPQLAEYIAAGKEIEDHAHKIAYIDIQISNITGLSRGQYRYWGEQKKPANVTPINRPTTVTAQTSGSPTQAGPKPPATNPGLERQRERKKSQDNK